MGKRSWRILSATPAHTGFVGTVTKSELHVLISACPAGLRGSAEGTNRNLRSIILTSQIVFGASGFVSRSQQGAEKLLSAPNSHERKTKFHHNVDHLWMRMIFQERPLEKETGKIKTIVLREHDLKESTGSTQQRVYGIELHYSTLPDFWLLSNFKLLFFF